MNSFFTLSLSAEREYHAEDQTVTTNASSNEGSEEQPAPTDWTDSRNLGNGRRGFSDSSSRIESSTPQQSAVEDSGCENERGSTHDGTNDEIDSVLFTCGG